jgi:hypothetical protein
MMTIQAFLQRLRETEERKTWTELFVTSFSPFYLLSIARGKDCFPASFNFGRYTLLPEEAM